MGGHSASMRPEPAVGANSADGAAERGHAQKTPCLHTPAPSFNEVYETYFDYVWRSARRLGAVEATLDDVVQDVFMAVHRRLGDFEGRSSIKTWLFGITLRVVRDHRRTARRKPTQPMLAEPEDIDGGTPHEAALRAQAARLLYDLLDGLDDDKREVFVLMELEQMTAPEVGNLLGLNVNTVYGRIRAARREFEQGVARLRAGIQRRQS